MGRKKIKVGDKVKADFWWIELICTVTHKDRNGYLHIEPDIYFYDKYGHAYQKLEDGRLERRTSKGIRLIQ